ncbi:DUF6331 family protein [Microbulbifer sp. OS29]|uniref:DUF6331 family protein n=1 Tax=Microbulbifer okhotskensis TaxID=2926617 RepID=A0A9X2ER69_9GAMM|nr:DUF6331 family protein [Microbulbifer okhotskensis]MCO1336341.1 DUF6331 family protein [Microbulbifer okhotskensis]
MNNQHDISIGSDQWIIVPDPKSTKDDATEIDPYMQMLLPTRKALETQCFSTCCGIDAYDLWEEDTIKNTKKFNHRELIDCIVRPKAKIMNLENEVLVSSTLNNFFTRAVFLQLLEHLLKTYNNVQRNSLSEN